MNSLLKLRPGMSSRFLSQNMAQKEPEKKILSTGQSNEHVIV
jgi:hypothetical protein